MFHYDKKMSLSNNLWGLLTYNTQNLGDDVQSLAALRHIPRVNHFVNRDDLRPWAEVENLNLIMNAWWSHYPENLLELKTLQFNPLFISFHLAHEGVLSANGTTMEDVLLSSAFREILASNAPIGCRDLYTMDKLERIGIPAYFSGCLTTTIKPNPELEISNPDGNLLLADLNPNLVSKIKSVYKFGITQSVNDTSQKLTPVERLVKAQHALNEIQRSRAVITSRLHIALPALAIGVPVILVTENQSNPRLDSFKPWLNTTEKSKIVEQVQEFSNSGLPVNPTIHLEYAASLETKISDWKKTFSDQDSDFDLNETVTLDYIRKQSIKNKNDLIQSAKKDLYNFQFSPQARLSQLQGEGFRTRSKKLMTKICVRTFSEVKYWSILGKYRLLHVNKIINLIDDSKITYLTKLKLLDIARSLEQVNTENVIGSIVECGVGLGGSSILLEKVNIQKRDLLMYDVFGMIPAPTDEDESDSRNRYAEIASFRSPGIGGNLYYGYEQDLLKKVKSNFEEFFIDTKEKHIKFIVGDVRSTLELGDMKIALAHIDLDWYQGVQVALVKLWKNLSSGGVIIIDDYWAYNGCKKATDEFLKSIPNQFFISKTISFKIIKI
jgi:asparagine synthase (glutamine-hydrolysing)